MNHLRKVPTIQDVARFANVSTATVSRALSCPERVSESTRARISDAVHQTGYTLNQTARSLRQRTSNTILVALPDIRNAFFSSILDAIEREASLRGYSVLIANLFFGHEPVKRLRQYFLSHRADGLVLLDGSIEIDQLRELTTGPVAVPVVVACEPILDAEFHTVVTDNAPAAERATRHLIELGHTRIGHLKGPPNNVIADYRLVGFTKAMEDAGLAVRREWLLEAGFRMEGGVAAAEAFHQLTERPTAMFVSNDESAIGLLSKLRAFGIECPRDVSVIGFDDLEFASHFAPPLTTMRQPREELGRLAASALIDYLESPQDAVAQKVIELHSELVVRDSTRALDVSPR